MTRHQVKYCSQKCQATKRYEDSINDWRNGTKHGTVGIQSRIITSFLRRYLFDKYNSKCSICGWGEKNKKSGKIPLEVDHIDGNSENNAEENLRLLCPNCHSLTPCYRNLNKGKGRKWRMDNINAQSRQSF
ncbi:MAG: HNH endonuclease signature motif containing protein [bacterium]|nr:HNH endonuclease signature motif containing protein [bacterium]